MKILLATMDNKPERWVEPLQAKLPNAEIIVYTDGMGYQQADYAIVWKPPGRLFTTETTLKAILNIGAGIEAILKLPELPTDLPVYRLEDAGMGPQMAEYVLHQVVETTRQMSAYRKQQKAGTWKMLRPIDRSAWPVGIMGLGQIGNAVAHGLRQFDYTVNGWSRSKHDIEGVTTFAGEGQFSAFLKASRILVNTLPLTFDTTGILNASTFAQLRDDAVLINVGRGGHLNETDLLHTIDEGRIIQATLDVFEHEPLPADHPFWTHDRITVTPHISASTLPQEAMTQIAGKIQALEAGEAISGRVDRSRGY